MDLRPFARDPAAFQRELHVKTAAGPRRFGDVMADFQRERFAALNPSLVAVAAGAEPPLKRFWWEATKGASKDSDISVCLLFLLAFAPRALRIQIGAYDQDQADEVRLIVRELLRFDAPLNRAVSAMVEVRADSIVNTRTGSTAEILTTDSKGSHGSRPDVVFLNELSHVGDREFAETLVDNLDKMPRGVGIIATNAGWRDSWQAEWKAAAVGSGRWSVHVMARPAPWIDAADLEESARRNPPQRYRRLWWGEWVSGEGDALDRQYIDAAFTLAGPCAEPKDGFAYALGVDLGLKRDSAAAALVGIDVGHYRELPGTSRELTPLQEALIDLGRMDPPEDDVRTVLVGGTLRIELARLDLWTPAGGRVSLMQVETAVAEVGRRFRVGRILADQWQAALLVERLQARGLPAVGADFTGSLLKQLASVTLSAFQERRLALFAHEQLRRDLGALRILEKSYGVRLESPRGPDGHGDCATALGLGLLAVKALEHAPAIANHGQPLICWP